MLYNNPSGGEPGDPTNYRDLDHNDDHMHFPSAEKEDD